MNDDDIVGFSESLHWQVRVCQKAGAPISAAVLQALGHVAAADSTIDLPPLVRFGDFIPLRLLAALHALALDRRAPLLAMLLPTAGGSGDIGLGDSGENIRAAVAQALNADAAVLDDYLERTPQTNEVGRARPLRLVLSAIASRFPSLPVRLHELGSSGGLLLNADRLELLDGEVAGTLPRVASRIGYDLRPVDACSPAGRLLLSSYIWPDHVDRFRRLGAAITMAQNFPVEVQRIDALSALQHIGVEQGTATLVWHSALLPYLADIERVRLHAEFARLGAGATADAPFVVASWEVDSHAQARRLDFAAKMTVWNGGLPETSVLATGNSHATDVRVIV